MKLYCPFEWCSCRTCVELNTRNENLVQCFFRIIDLFTFHATRGYLHCVQEMRVVVFTALFAVNMFIQALRQCIYIAAHKHGNTQTIWNKISKVLHPIVDEAQ